MQGDAQQTQGRQIGAAVNSLDGVHQKLSKLQNDGGGGGGGGGNGGAVRLGARDRHELHEEVHLSLRVGGPGSGTGTGKRGCDEETYEGAIDP